MSVEAGVPMSAGAPGAAADGPGPARGRCGALETALGSSVAHQVLLALFAVASFAAVVAYTRWKTGVFGFAMDDAWIHMTVARNFLEGQGWGVVPGRTIPVSTSPTWTLLVALFYAVLRSPVPAVLAASCLSTVAACVLCYRLTALLTGVPLLGLAAAVGLLFQPPVLWGMTSGMESSFVIAVLLAALLLYYGADAASPRRRFAVPVALAFAAVTRPELFVLIPLALADTFFALWRRSTPGDRRLAVRTLLVQSALALLALAPYFAFNLTSGGHLFPLTFYAKTRVRGVGLAAALASGAPGALRDALVSHPVEEFLDVLATIGRPSPLLPLLVLVGLAAFTRRTGTPAEGRGALLPAAMLLLPLAMGASAPAAHFSNHAHRYYIVFSAFAVVLGTVGAGAILRWTGQRALAALFAVIALALPLTAARPTLRVLAEDVDLTEGLYPPAGTWIAEHVPPSAVLAVNDIGGVGYFARRDFIDVMGLASPEIWGAISRPPGAPFPYRRLRNYLKANKVEYLLLSPRYYRQLTNDRRTFEPVMTWKEHSTSPRLVWPQILYRCHWD